MYTGSSKIVVKSLPFDQYFNLKGKIFQSIFYISRIKVSCPVLNAKIKAHKTLMTQV